MYSLLYIIPLILIGEAAIEAKFGDKNHTLSFLVSIVLAFIATLNLVPVKDINLFLAWGSWYVVGRVYFDYVYNLFKGLPLNYLGNTAKTDKFLKSTGWSLMVISLLRLLTAQVFFLLTADQLARYYEKIGKDSNFELWLGISVFSLMIGFGILGYINWKKDKNK